MGGSPPTDMLPATSAGIAVPIGKAPIPPEPMRESMNHGVGVPVVSGIISTSSKATEKDIHARPRKSVSVHTNKYREVRNVRLPSMAWPESSRSQFDIPIRIFDNSDHYDLWPRGSIRCASRAQLQREGALLLWRESHLYLLGVHFHSRGAFAGGSQPSLQEHISIPSPWMQ